MFGPGLAIVTFVIGMPIWEVPLVELLICAEAKLDGPDPNLAGKWMSWGGYWW